MSASLASVLDKPLASRLADPELLRQQCYIDGQWTGTPVHDVVDPATGRPIARVPDLGAGETAQAIAAADRALSGWRSRTAADRSRLLRRWFDLMMAAQDDLAEILTAEQGKPLAEARGEIAYAASFLEWFAEEAKRIYGETIPAHRQDARIVVLRQPVGVVAAITPWNFPAAMVTRKVGPALAAGCTLVLKPAPQTPLTALALAVLAERAGIPAGVLNIVTGDAKAIGGELTANPVVRALSFTGSTAVGKLLAAQCAATMKKVSMELGGNAPFIVFDDADLDAAIEGALVAKYRNNGQTCVCVNRFYIHSTVADAFEEKLKTRVAALRIGAGQDTGSILGPLIDRNAVAKVEAHIADATSKGARLVTGGKRHALGHGFFEPTILAGCTPDMRLANEETFGPLAALFTFNDDAEVIAQANASEVGLAGYFYTRGLARAWKVAEQLEVGIVGVNTGLISTEVAPFGGIKQSGLGREGSRHGVEDYVELKYLCVAGL
jgi:succinate-semialdehyde dehydrogenase/glutarate-semialdehyde dehydrogenase